MTLRAVVVGSTNVDLVIPVAGLPRPGETVLGGDVQRLPGGKGGNQAVALARLGAQVHFVSAVGRDAEGEWSRALLAAEGVDVTGVAVLDVPTGLAVVTVDAHGENSIVVAPGANAHVAPPADLEADVVLLSLEIPVSTVTAVALRAQCPVVLNAAPAQPLPAELLAAVDVLVVNESEWNALGQPRGGVVVTLGSKGARLLTATGSVDVPAVPVDVVDTTGAGDCFAAALAYGVGHRWAPSDATAFACRAAALSVRALGARGGLPSLAEVRGPLR